MVIVLLKFLAAAWGVASGILTLSMIICCILDFRDARKIKRQERAQQRTRRELLSRNLHRL